MLQALATFLRTLFGGLSKPGLLLKGLREILRGAWRALRRLFGLHHREHGQGGDCCLELPDVYRRPDPLIYAQYYLMSMGLAVTWDNPDIELFERGSGGPESLGAPVSSSALKPHHIYRVRVRVWNGSYDAPAVGLPVHLSYLSFGAGTVSHPVATRLIDLGVKGSSKCPAFAFFDWPTPPAGHYCLQARLEWSDDANPNNNLGQENVEIGVPHSPAAFTFALRNDGAVRRQFVLEPDAYRLPELKPCGETEQPKRAAGRPTRLAESRARWEKARREQGRDNFPLPADWNVQIDPTQLVLGANEEREITVSVDVPEGTRGRPALNVNAFALHEGAGRDFVGGVTLYVDKA